MGPTPTKLMSELHKSSTAQVQFIMRPNYLWSRICILKKFASILLQVNMRPSREHFLLTGSLFQASSDGRLWCYIFSDGPDTHKHPQKQTNIKRFNLCFLNFKVKNKKKHTNWNSIKGWPHGAVALISTQPQSHRNIITNVLHCNKRSSTWN